MFYLISQVMLILASASLVGMGLGRVLRGIKAARAAANLGDSQAELAAAAIAAEKESLRHAVIVVDTHHS